jgi:hypothetical protein
MRNGFGNIVMNILNSNNFIDEIIPRSNHTSQKTLHKKNWHCIYAIEMILSLLKNNCMPQKNHDKAAQHNEEAAKHHKSASKHASEGNHEKAAQHAQAAQGHQQKANEHSGKAAAKYAEKAGTMKKEEMEDEEMQGTGNGKKSNRN